MPQPAPASSWHKPENLLMVIALGCTALLTVLFSIDLSISHRHTLRDAEHRLGDFGLTMAEHTARSYEAIDSLLREISKDLGNGQRDWEHWDDTNGWEYLAERHRRNMPQLRQLVLLDHEGNQRFSSSSLQTKRVNVADRPYFIALRNGAERSAQGPYRSRNTGTYIYSMTRRISHQGNEFSGLILASSDPANFHEYCWPKRLNDQFEAVLANTQGEIIASCRLIDTSSQSAILGARADSVLFNGRLEGQLSNTEITHVNGWLASSTPVPGFPDLRIITAMPEDAFLHDWRVRCVELIFATLLVGGLLLLAAWSLRRQVRRTLTLTDTQESKQQILESRIAEGELALAEQKMAAENANLAKSRFLAAASHDLRQPLHALGLFAADLQHQIRLGKTDDLPHLAKQITQSTNSLSALLNALLDISRLDVNGIKPEIHAFPLAAVLQRLEETFKREAAEHNLRLRFHTRTRIWLETDPTLLERMLGNLIANAIRYTPPAGRILVGVRRCGKRIALEVRDSGIGIASEHQQNIFGEFYQVGNQARDSEKGLGLGLSIVRRLGRALNIEITLNSHLGEGSNFRLLMHPAAREIHSRQAEQSHQGPRICCIGSSEEMQECQGLLTRWDYLVSHYATPAEAVFPIDMPVLTDAEYAQAMRAQLASNVPIIALCHDDRWELPAETHAMPTPLRPARLRALVAQLQKTFSRSMP